MSDDTKDELTDEQKAAADEAAKAAKKPKLVKMVRDKDQYPEGPHSADVHPDEVENWKQAGWAPAK